MKSSAAILLLLSVSASALTDSLSPVADAFVSSNSDPNILGTAAIRDSNYGAAGALQVSAPGSARGEMQSLLRFDLSGSKTTFDNTYGVGKWTIRSIKLQLSTNYGTQDAQPNNPIFNSINHGLFAIDWLAKDNWIEGTGKPSFPTTDGVTYNSLPSIKSGADRLVGTFNYTPVGDTNPPTVPPATYNFTLDPSLVTDVSAGDLVSFRVYAADTGVSYQFNSRDYIESLSNRPFLLLDVVPEPDATALLASAAWICCAWRWRDAHSA